jgi:hypothetical protein
MATPSSAPDTPNAVAGERLNNMFGTMPESAGINKMIHDIAEAWNKLGLGSSVPARAEALFGSGAGTTIYDRLARRNLLMNGSCRTKQRTTMPTVDNSYGFDGWRVLMENANGCTLAQESADLPTLGPAYAAKLIVGAGNNGKFGHWQPILYEDCRDIAGGVVSLQGQIKASNARLANTRLAVMQFAGTPNAISGDPISAWGADGTNPTPAASWSFAGTPISLGVTTAWLPYYVENVPISSAAKNLAVMYWCDARTTTVGDYLLATDVQLERGAVCSAVDRVPLAQEIWDAYYWLYAPVGESVGRASSASLLYQEAFNMPRPMRGNPSLAAGASFSASTGNNGTPSFAATGNRGGTLSNSGSAWTTEARLTLTGVLSAEP